jgi:YidC/Oxa1 family membrane protein insertase
MLGWDSFVGFFTALLVALSQAYGGNLGFAIITVSVLTRLALLPLTLRVARHALAQQKILYGLKADIKKLRERHKSNPQELAASLSELYRQHGVKPVSAGGIAGGAVQALVGGGLYAALARGLARGHSFVWIRDLGQPDAILALGTAAITFVASIVGPHLPEQSRTAAAILPAVLTLFMAWRLSSAIVLYWASSAAMNGVQALILRAKAS